MRWLIVFALVLSGCASEAPTDDVEQEPVEVLLTAVHYENSYERLHIRAVEPLMIEGTFAGTVPMDADSHCAAFAMGMDTGETTPMGSLVIWTPSVGFEAEVRAAGQQHMVTAPLVLADGYVQVNGEMTIEVPAGATLVLDLGGDQMVGSGWRFDAVIDGAYEITEGTGGALACGAGPRGAEDGLGASFFLADAEVGGVVGLETQNASTMIVHERSDTPTNRLTAEFLGQESVVEELYTKAAMEGGTMRLHFDQSVTTLDMPLWLMADAYWQV